MFKFTASPFWKPFVPGIYHGELVGKVMNGKIVLVGGKNVLRGSGKAPGVWPVQIVGRGETRKAVLSDKKQVRLPVEAIKTVTCGNGTYDVIEWPGVIELDFGIVKVCFLGCYAWDVVTGERAFFSVDPIRIAGSDEFEVQDLMALVDAIEHTQEKTSPGYSAAMSDEGPPVLGETFQDVEYTGITDEEEKKKWFLENYEKDKVEYQKMLELRDEELKKLTRETDLMKENQKLVLEALTQQVNTWSKGEWKKGTVLTRDGEREARLAAGRAELARIKEMNKPAGLRVIDGMVYVDAIVHVPEVKRKRSVNVTVGEDGVFDLTVEEEALEKEVVVETEDRDDDASIL